MGGDEIFQQECHEVMYDPRTNYIANFDYSISESPIYNTESGLTCSQEPCHTDEIGPPPTLWY